VLIRFGYDIRFEVPAPVPMVALLYVHPSRLLDLRTPDDMQVEPWSPIEIYYDSFGNRSARFVAQPGKLRLHGTGLIQDSGSPDAVNWNAREVPVQHLPHDVLRYLLSSRYCEVDLLSDIAAKLFGGLMPGWNRVQAICNWVNCHIAFGYQHARPTRTALEAYNERIGVCRDFQHLAVTFCRSLNIPARYVTGYLGDIGVTPVPCPMDFSAWFEVYLENRWWTFDARHNQPRIGRVLVAVGRDASDVAITTSFGTTDLKQFTIVTDQALESASTSA
jgi:transglutaminase-like putative cysteine protease